jgi:hypothetical protein
MWVVRRAGPLQSRAGWSRTGVRATRWPSSSEWPRLYPSRDVPVTCPLATENKINSGTFGSYRAGDGNIADPRTSVRYAPGGPPAPPLDRTAHVRSRQGRRTRIRKGAGCRARTAWAVAGPGCDRGQEWGAAAKGIRGVRGVHGQTEPARSPDAHRRALEM